MALNPVLVNLQLQMTALETINPLAGDVVGGQISHSGFNYQPQQLTSSSAQWPVSGCGYVNVTVGNSTVTIDLTNLTVNLTNSQTTIINASGKKVRGVIVSTISTGNVNPITIQPSGTNGYYLDSNTFSWTLGPSEARCAWKGNSTPAISNTAKVIQFTGTNANDNIDIGFVFG